MFACKSVYRFACCICCCCNLALFLQDDGFDPPCGSNPLPIVNFLYVYAETSTLRDSLMRHSRHKRSQKNATHCEDQLGLVKLARVTLYRRYGDFDIWHFDTRKGIFFQVGGMRFLKECLQALPPPLSFSLPDPARRWSRSSPARFFARPHWPRAWNRLFHDCSTFHFPNSMTRWFLLKNSCPHEVFLLFP